jgi:hypothetical protein
MIATLLVAQLAAAQLIGADAPRNPPGAFASPKAEIIQTLPRASACMGNVGRLEASLAEPAALYRKGDRPAKGLRRWADYPQASVCLIGAAR